MYCFGDLANGWLTRECWGCCAFLNALQSTRPYGHGRAVRPRRYMCWDVKFNNRRCVHGRCGAHVVLVVLRSIWLSTSLSGLWTFGYVRSICFVFDWYMLMPVGIVRSAILSCQPSMLQDMHATRAVTLMGLPDR